MRNLASALAAVAAISLSLPSSAATAPQDVRADGGRLVMVQYGSGYRPSRPPYRPPPAHHYHQKKDNTGAVVAAGVAGLLLGTVIANANRYDPPPAPLPYSQMNTYVEPYQGHDWAQYCSAKFTTYDPRSGTYLAGDGQHYPCH